MITAMFRCVLRWSSATWMKDTLIFAGGIIPMDNCALCSGKWSRRTHQKTHWKDIGFFIARGSNGIELALTRWLAANGTPAWLAAPDHARPELELRNVASSCAAGAQQSGFVYARKRINKKRMEE